jgi:hypothetical protein
MLGSLLTTLSHFPDHVPSISVAPNGFPFTTNAAFGTPTPLLLTSIVHCVPAKKGTANKQKRINDFTQSVYPKDLIHCPFKITVIPSLFDIKEF